MKHRLFACITALCLCLCFAMVVPTKSVAASITAGTPEYSSLQAFLTQLSAHGTYDSQNVTAGGKTFWGYQPTNIMDSVLSGEMTCCDYSIYPIEQPEQFWTGSDPLKRFGAYTRFPAASVEWVLKNIYNCSQTGMDALKAYVEKSSSFYYLNGYYYTHACRRGS